jgi:transcriptional regulator with XRE-family HTH domain
MACLLVTDLATAGGRAVQSAVFLFFLFFCLTILHIAIIISHIAILEADGAMRLGEKMRYLREVEGTLRNLGRDMTQQEVVRALKKSTGKTISQSYLSQIESGARPHLTNSTRMLLARFFNVHPGYLVDDPEGYHTELLSPLRVAEDSMDLWLINGAERFRRDPQLRHALLEISQHNDSRRCLILLGTILETPQLADRLLQVLKPEAKTSSSPSHRRSR